MSKEQQFSILHGFASGWKRFMEGRACPPAIHGSSGLYSVPQFHAALEREQARAERNRHQVSLVLIRTSDRDHELHGRPCLVDILRGRLRIMDEGGWFDRSRLGVLMPYTSREGARHMVEDLCRLMEGGLSPSDCEIYTYPRDWFSGDRDREVEDAAVAAEDYVSEPVGSRVDRSVAIASQESRASQVGPDAHPARERSSDAPECEYRLGPGPAADLSLAQRGLDIAGSLFGLIVLSPLFLAVAVLIKLASPGPVFFKQVWIGRGGRPFLLWKFRTMRAYADTAIHQGHMAELIRSANRAAAAKPMEKLNNDPRVIPLGWILRGTCIDELPQLINVLRGEMSLVGPRPLIPYEVREYLPWQTRRLDTTPGLTGLWQVSGKGRLTFDEMVRLDIRYVRTRSVVKTAAILCRTPYAVAQETVDAWVRRKMRVGTSQHG
jgi:lipopolysaccharide/colanic/teichoic acid biosynthesis glycosyltransferase